VLACATLALIDWVAIDIDTDTERSLLPEVLVSQGNLAISSVLGSFLCECLIVLEY
jgi:hypothetical protein